MHDSYNDPDKAEDIPAVAFMDNLEENRRKLEKMKPFMLAKARATAYFGTKTLNKLLSNYEGDEDNYDELAEYLTLLLEIAERFGWELMSEIWGHHPKTLSSLESLEGQKSMLIFAGA